MPPDLLSSEVRSPATHASAELHPGSRDGALIALAFNLLMVVGAVVSIVLTVRPERIAKDTG